MIKNITFNNFYSFYEATNIDFELNDKISKSYYDININLKNSNKIRLNKTISILGANGSGKTHCLKILLFITSFITGIIKRPNIDKNEKLPYEPHILHQNEDTNIILEFILDNIEYKYELILNSYNLLSESLYSKTSKSYSYIFKRKKKYIEDEFTYKYNSKKFTLKLIPAKNCNKNISIIYEALKYSDELSINIDKYFNNIGMINIFNHYINNSEILIYNNHSSSDDDFISELYNDHEDIFKNVKEIIKRFDLGLEDIKIIKDNKIDKNGDKKEYFRSNFTHIAKDNQKFILPYQKQSDGTKHLFEKLFSIFYAFEYGGIVIFDELDNYTHIHILIKTLELFEDPGFNKKDAQIIFTSHTPEVLNELKKHQVYLIQKDDANSISYRLDNIKGLRSDDNLYSKYCIGRLGATPNL
jgi:uncharacterized protein